MTILIIVLAVIVAVVLVALVALNPVLKKRADGAIEDARAALGGRPNVRLIEPKAVGHGSEPDEAGGLRGQGVLAVSDTALVFVTWAPRNTFLIERSAITGVTTSAPDARVMDKATIRDRLHQRRGSGDGLVPPARAGPLARHPGLRLGPRRRSLVRGGRGRGRRRLRSAPPASVGGADHPSRQVAGEGAAQLHGRAVDHGGAEAPLGAPQAGPAAGDVVDEGVVVVVQLVE